jgi:class 3 adenylate cyclase
MNTTSQLEQPGKQGLWDWLLRNTGLAAWFQRPPAATHAGQEERVFLMLSLPEPTPRHTALLAEVLREHQPLIEAGGGRLGSYQSGRLLLSWPRALGCQQARAVATYFQLCDALGRRDGSPGLRGAATIGQAALKSGSQHAGQVINHVAGLLQECQRQQSSLLISAVLHEQLEVLPTLHYTLDVAFKVAGHRYPATIYHVANKPSA